VRQASHEIREATAAVTRLKQAPPTRTTQRAPAIRRAEVQDQASPPITAVEEAKKYEQAVGVEAPSAAIRTPGTDAEQIDPGDIVDWLFKESPRRR
jgi:hypothetical protein